MTKLPIPDFSGEEGGGRGGGGNQGRRGLADEEEGTVRKTAFCEGGRGAGRSTVSITADGK